MSSLTAVSPHLRNQVTSKRPDYTPIQSDCLESDGSPATVKRSASLTTLQPTIFEPRMAQLETLEAKMASIEVSLSSTPRRKKNGSISGVSLGGSIRSVPKDVAVKELESLRNALRDKENIIQSLKGQLSIPGLRLAHNIRNGNICNNSNTGSIRELSEVEKKQAEDRLARLRNDIDTKRLAIKNLKMALERLDITDNIDVRIQQAELEYQLGREELNLLTLLEETRALQHCLEESNKKVSESHTLYSCLSGNNVSLHTTEIVYDPKSPRFGAGQRDNTPGLWVDWALEETGLCKGDRLLEVNGKIVLTKSRDDLARLLQAAPDPALLVVLRKGNTGSCVVTSTKNGSHEVAALRCELDVVKERAEEAQRAKDGLRSDNIRLTHRISYLEEQVSELLSKKDSDIRIVTQSPVITSTVKTNQNITNINICSQPTTVLTNGKDKQVFQKGPQMTTLSSNVPGLVTTKESHTALPVRSKSSLSNVSNTQITAPSPQPSDHSCHKSHRHKYRTPRNGLMLTSSSQNLDQVHKKHHHHHHHHREKDYNSETSSAIENFRNRKSLDHPRLTEYNDSNVMDQSYRKATKIVQDLTKNKESLYEKHRAKCIGASEKYNADVLRHYNARKSTSVLDFRSEIHLGPKYASDSRSVEELDNIDTKSNNKRLFKKLHDARSVKSLDFDSDCNYPPTSKSIDYTSEPLENHKANAKPRPTPPKKPLRLSLHKAQSLQSVESPAIIMDNNFINDKNDSRKPMKRNYKGETPIITNCNMEKINGFNGLSRNDISHSETKWTSFAQKRDNLIYVNDNKKNWL